jgi:subtilisin family serine protease
LRQRKTLVAGVAVLAIASMFTGTQSSIAAPASATADPHTVTPPGVHSVTLITGDVVTTRQSGAGGTVDVRRSDGSPADAQIMESGNDLFVYPQAAMPYVAAGTLDKRLFDVTQLVADGYDDEHIEQLPLIVTYTNTALRSRATATPKGSAKVRELASVQGAALTEDRRQSAGFWAAVTGGSDNTRLSSGSSPAFRAGISRIWLDGKVKADLADTTAQIGAPEVWAGGDTGQGVDVAVLDTGVDTGHPDLAGRIADTVSFVPDQDVTDRTGHGTHVASTIAGTGAASGGKEKGVAPGARLDIGKVLGDDGSGQFSWVLAGMEWAARDKHAKIISMSLGSGPSDGSDPLSQAVNSLSAETGALFVIAAGNDGLTGAGSVSAPGTADAALTVGAVDGNDNLADFSSQGPRLGDEALKPELTAPGVDVLAARSQYAPEGEGYYQSLSGTSMATPHVAGAAALLAAEQPGLTGQQLKDALVSTAKATPKYDAYQAGNGRVDAAAAAHATVFATGTAFTGRASATDNGTYQRPVTYTNTSGSPVTLDLTVDAPNAPAGVFTLSTPQVTVPAHGTVTATLSINSTPASGSTHYTGQIVASSAHVVMARTAIALGGATHKLTVVVKNRKGNATTGTVELLRAGSAFPDFYPIDDTGRFEVYLPDDLYSVMAFVNVQGTHGPNSLGMALMGDPDVTLDHDAEVDLDVSAIRRVDATTPQESRPTYERFEYFRKMKGAFYRSIMETAGRYDSLWAQPTTAKVTHGDFYVAARWRKEQPALSVTTPTADFSDVLRQLGTTQLPKGHWDLPVVAAGNGGGADYAGLDVKGKVVVVRRNSSVTDVQQADAAAAAGAKLLLVANDQLGLEVRRYARDPLKPTPIEVALLSTDEGEKLIQQAERGPISVKVVSQPVSDYAYDLMETWHQSIPKDLVRHEDKNTLARIDVGFDSPDPTRGGGEFRFDWPSYNSNWGVGTTARVPVNGKRTDWVSTGDTYVWGQEAYVEGLLYEIEPQSSYRGGSSTEHEWFKPIERPYLNNNYKLPTRTANELSFDIPGWGGGDHVGMAMDQQLMRQTVSLYQGNTELAQGTPWGVLAADAPSAGKLPYRLVMRGEKDPSVSPYSATTTTEWDFRSAAPSGQDADVLPLLQLDYKIATDSGGKVTGRAGLSVSASHLPGAADAGKIGPVTLEVSYDDGKTWQKTALDGSGEVGLHAPPKAQFVSLRANARDTAGNAITQTVIHAFGLR